MQTDVFSECGEAIRTYNLRRLVPDSTACTLGGCLKHGSSDAAGVLEWKKFLDPG